MACSRVETFEDDAKIAVRDTAFSDRVQVHAFTGAHEERKDDPWSRLARKVVESLGIEEQDSVTALPGCMLTPLESNMRACDHATWRQRYEQRGGHHDAIRLGAYRLPVKLAVLHLTKSLAPLAWLSLELTLWLRATLVTALALLRSLSQCSACSSLPWALPKPETLSRES